METQREMENCPGECYLNLKDRKLPALSLSGPLQNQT
jgi:hypothetical protein